MLAPAAVRRADTAAIADGADALRRGRLVAFPTETVYGLGADAGNDRAVAAIFAAKGRPQFNPLIVHVLGLAEAEILAEFTPLARRLAEAFWPGALTLVLPRRRDARLSLLVSAGLDTVALRAPSNAVARALLKAAGCAIAAPSANRSGSVSPTTAAHVAESLGGRVDVILDGGPTALGIESTVIGFDGDLPVLLRPGAVTREAIEKIAGPLSQAGEKIASPGMLASHYAPHAPMRLNAREVSADEALLAFGPAVPQGAKITANLSPSGDLTEAAANLFAMLRELDTRGARRIAVMPIPVHGLGEAINDRLARAAAPRGKP
ncbi:MAG: threonylcarbamoyl-AMP synthase [Pseudomonadota bacterium]|nr:threonylcarbamoyl-AMP synthase [Pseudomonadota bacterium]